MTNQSNPEPNHGMFAGFNGGRLLQVLLSAACVFVILYGVQNMAGLITPVLVAFLMAVGLAPVIGYFQRRGLSRPLAFVALIGIMVVIFVATAILLSSSMSRMIAKMPEYAANMQARTAEAGNATAAFGVDTQGLYPTSIPGSPNEQAIQNALWSSMSYLLGLLGTVFWIFMLFIFFLGDIIDLPKRISGGLEVDPGLLPRLDQVRDNVTTYFSIRTKVGIFTGVFNTIVCLLFGVDFAILWGFVAFITNYLPSFGFILSAIPPIIFAFLEFGAERAIIVALLLLGVNTIVDQLISPRLTSQGMSLPVSVVLLSMTFWGWLIGPIGALLAAPLTIILKLTLDAFPEARNVTSLITMGQKEGEQPAEPGKTPRIRIPMPRFLRRRKPEADTDQKTASPDQVESPPESI